MGYSILQKSLFTLFFVTTNLLGTSGQIADVNQLTRTSISALEKPKTLDKLRSIVLHANKPISIAGGRYSQGGQIAYPGGIVVDMTNLNRITNFNLQQKTITVQTGATWRDVQKYIDPHNLSIKVMQSYNDFTVGGSLSVNVHGRSMEYGQLIETVESIKIMLADGSMVQASKHENYELFRAAIGGYGLVGIIVEATLHLTDNVKLARNIKYLSIDKYPDYFEKTIKPDKNIVFHNANLYPSELKEVLSVTYYKTDKQPTIPQRMQSYRRFFPKLMIGELFVRRIPLLKRVRPKIDAKRLSEEKVSWRNYEMSYTVRSLEPLFRFPTTTILQEYFIPTDKLTHFINDLRRTAQKYNINLINVSIRHVPKNTESLLSYAPQESFAFVLYINILNTRMGKELAKKWTQKLVDQALALDGTYYLPYQLYATPEQLRQAYPKFDKFIELKKKYDPHNKFSNRLFEKYR